jgi:hypothetical protein
VQSVADVTRMPALADGAATNSNAVAQVAAAAMRWTFRVSEFKVIPP